MPNWSYETHKANIKRYGLCYGCSYCCDTCLNDGHHCAICNDVVGHYHSHEEEEDE